MVDMAAAEEGTAEVEVEDVSSLFLLSLVVVDRHSPFPPSCLTLLSVDGGGGGYNSGYAGGGGGGGYGGGRGGGRGGAGCEYKSLVNHYNLQPLMNSTNFADGGGGPNSAWDS